MKKELIQKNVDEAVRVFKECLERTYVENKKPFYGVGYHSLTAFFSGKVTFTRKKNGALRMSGEIPKIAFKDSIEGLPRNIDDWNIYPIVFTLFNENVISKEEKH